MATNQHELATRAMNADHAVASARLSGLNPSPHLASLLCQYRAGLLSSVQLLESLKTHYQRSE